MRLALLALLVVAQPANATYCVTQETPVIPTFEITPPDPPPVVVVSGGQRPHAAARSKVRGQRQAVR